MLKKWRRKLRGQHNQHRLRERDILQQLSPYYPNSAFTFDYPNFTYTCAKNFPDQLESLIKRSQLAARLPQVRPVDQIGLADELATLLDHYGSDKNALHNYTPLYTSVLRPLRDRMDVALLEVGLGTNHPKLISTMGPEGKPGASIRAFADYLPDARIFGADIDSKILFQTDRIRTAPVDQLKLDTFTEMTDALGCNQFDIIIDDGLHSPEANLNTLMFGLSALKAHGCIIIEDIPRRALSVWSTVSAILGGDDIRCEVVEAASQSHLFVVEKLS